MRRHFLPLLTLFGTALLTAGLCRSDTALATDVTTATIQADRDWEKLKEFLRDAENQLAAMASAPPSKRLSALDSIERKLLENAFSFYDAHPQDPRRWEAVYQADRRRPGFFKEVFPEYDNNPRPENLVVEEALKKEKLQRLAELVSAMQSAPDVPRNVRLMDGKRLLAKAFSAAEKPDAVIDWAELENRLDVFENQFADGDDAMFAEVRFLRLLERKRPAQVAARLEKSARSGTKSVRDYAARRQALADARQRPLELTFTALDGRAVDLARWRGKVVLIDFWATWCGPCREELPNVKQVYQTFHDSGFEVIGVSLDQARDETALRKFLETEALPWPQYFDGLGWKTALAQQFGVTSIPAVFLLARDGTLATTTARGKDLEAQVRRLLKEP